jgi:hypothetical protein
MELLDRYLREVAQWLPRRQSADIVAEISADLLAEAEGQAQALGRPVSRGEEEAILTRWGHPMLVASRYQPQESLIGPALLPTYHFVLKVLSLVYVLPWWFVWLWFAILDPSWRASHPDLVVSLGPLAFNALFLFALVTGIFAAVERRHRREATLETWTARELTSARRRDWREVSRVGSVFEIVIGLAAIAWWTGLAGSPSSFVIDDAVRVTWRPLESAFYWTLLALMVAAAGMSTANLVRPKWTARRLRLQAALDAIGVLVVCLMLPIALVQVVPGAADGDRVAMLVRWINLSWRVSLVVAGVVLAAGMVLGIVRLGRVDRGTPTVAAG